MCADIVTDFKCSIIKMVGNNYECVKDSCVTNYYYTEDKCCESSLLKVEFFNGIQCTLTTRV